MNVINMNVGGGGGSLISGSSSNRYELLGAKFSYYTGKVRAYLIFKNISFVEIEATPEVYKTIIIPKTGVRYVPVLLTCDGTAIQDSTDIIDYLERIYPTPSVYPSTPTQHFVSLLFELLGDEWLLLPAMHYRWNFHENHDFIFREFGTLSLGPATSQDEIMEAGKKMGAFFKNSTTGLGISRETSHSIEQFTEELFITLDNHFKTYEYLLGSRPSIGDYGLMGPLYAHLGRDPYPKALMMKIAPNLYQWVERMNKPPSRIGDFIENDVIPPTLDSILQRLFTEYFPILQDTDRRLSEWVRENNNEIIKEIPRTIGTHKFKIGEAEGERYVYPYCLWMLQRPLRVYIEIKDKTYVDKQLQKWGGYNMVNYAFAMQVKRVNNRLMIDNKSSKL